MDDYLWNRTGSDPEIERIEVALESFAYQPTAPPELPARQLAFIPPRRSFFRFSVSFAAALLVGLAVGTAWFLLRNEPPATQQASVGPIFQPPVTSMQTEAAPIFAESPKTSTPSKPKRRVVLPRPPEPNTIRPQTLVLTKEEADAYRQLMTALNITSTNLKIVKDKLDGTE
jgi:hypothetical protein